MQIGNVPQIVTDLTSVFALIAAFIGVTVAVRKIRWLRRLYNYLVTEPIGRWFRKEVCEATRPLADSIEQVRGQFADYRNEFEAHRAYVAYHLGPNGESPSIHSRIGNLEKITVIQLPPPQPPES